MSTCSRNAATLPVMPRVETDNADYDDGSPKHRGFRLEGAMHGKWEFYRRDGSLMRAGEFEQGDQVGTWRTYDRSGQVVKETEFREVQS
jgi:antitoxin component YwqK of YwqJK toxin-antitoxin module